MRPPAKEPKQLDMEVDFEQMSLTETKTKKAA